MEGREGGEREGEYGEKQWTGSALSLGREFPGTPLVVEYDGCLLECRNQAMLPKLIINSG